MAKKRHPPLITLTIYLLKDGADLESSLTDEASASLSSHVVRIGAKQSGTLYAKQSPTTPPSWISFFAGALSTDVRFKRTSVSAVFFIRAAKRLFAITFGQGRHFLKTEMIEDRFGLRVTLNSVDPDRLRLVDLTTSDANPVHTRRQASRVSGLNTFGINLDQDILKAVAGSPSDKDLGSHMTGIDALTVRVRTTLSTLHQALLRYLDKSSEKTYQASFKWVDQVAEVRDESIRERLFQRIADVLNGDASGNIWGAIPELIEWNRFDGFRIGSVGGSRVEDVDVDSMKSCFEGLPLTIEALRRRQVYCMADDVDQPVARWSFLRCLAGEVQFDGATYILNSESWYQVDQNYAAQIDADIRGIPQSTLVFPIWGDVNEGEYNMIHADRSAGKLALMDQKLVKHNGMVSPIEFCDLYSNNRQLIHVKHFSQSSVLSHLFSQGLVSASSLVSDAAFREKLNDLLPVSHRLENPLQRPSPEQYEVIFGIGSSRVGPLELPFFSRVTLRNVFRQLTQSLGFRMSLAKIRRDRLAQE